VLSHGWPLNSDSREAQALFLAGNGYRVIAHDRRDLAALVDFLDLAEVTMVGFSTGGGEVARYVGRHGQPMDIRSRVRLGKGEK
jgi:non-heme chloroperoxidase